MDRDWYKNGYIMTFNINTLKYIFYQQFCDNVPVNVFSYASYWAGIRRPPMASFLLSKVTNSSNQFTVSLRCKGLTLNFLHQHESIVQCTVCFHPLQGDIIALVVVLCEPEAVSGWGPGIELGPLTLFSLASENYQNACGGALNDQKWPYCNEKCFKYVLHFQ